MNQSQSHPRVSVILPTHNRPDLLRDAIESLLSQTYTDWEAMIVDDASDPAAELPVDQRFRALRHQTSMGGAAAKNAGASVSSADILAFLDDDDLYAPSYLERAVSVLDKHPEVVERIRKAYDRWWEKTVPLMVNEESPLAAEHPQEVRYEKQLKDRGIHDWVPREF